MRLAILRVAGAALRVISPTRPVRLPDRPRLLLIRPDHLGDVLLTSPAVELLRKAMPGARLTMMVGPWSEEVARRDPLLDDVRVFPFPGFTREPKGSPLAPYRSLWAAARAVRRERHDAALVLRFDHWWGAWMAALAGIPHRVGYGESECAPFLTRALPVSPGVHWAEQAMAVASALVDLWFAGEASAASPRESAARPEGRAGGAGEPPLRFQIGEEDERRADGLLESVGPRPDPMLVVFHPGSGAALKLWPEEHWVQLGRMLAARGVQIVVTGSPAERPLAQRIAQSVPGALSVAGRTELGTLAALFRRSALVAGVDSGPLHLAVAMGVPTVHLFGPTDPAVYGPWGDGARHRVISSGWPGSPCGRLDLEPAGGFPPQCMAEIDPEQVAAVCIEVMGSER